MRHLSLRAPRRVHMIKYSVSQMQCADARVVYGSGSGSRGRSIPDYRVLHVTTWLVPTRDSNHCHYDLAVKEYSLSLTSSHLPLNYYGLCTLGTTLYYRLCDKSVINIIGAPAAFSLLRIQVVSW